MNLSFLLLFGAVFSAISFVISILILKKVFSDEYKRPWLFITFGIFLYTPAQILRYLIENETSPADLMPLVHSLEFMGQGLILYALIFEYLILKLVKGNFVKMKFVPVQEGNMDGTLNIDVTKGQSYLAYKKDYSYLLDQFSDAVKKGYEGFLLTQFDPLEIRKNHGLVKTPILMITNPEKNIQSTQIDSNAMSIDALHFSAIIKEIDTFYDQAQNPIIMFQLDDIARYNPFDIILELLKYVKEKNKKFNGIFIISVNEDVINFSDILRVKDIYKDLD